MKAITKTILLILTLNFFNSYAFAYSENTCINKYNRLVDRINQLVKETKPGSSYNDCTKQLNYYGSDVCSSIRRIENKAIKKRDEMANKKWDLYNLSEEAKKLGRFSKCGSYEDIDHQLGNLEDFSYREFNKMHSREKEVYSGGMLRTKWVDGEYLELVKNCQDDLKEEKYRNGCH